MYPLLHPGALLMIDESRRRIVCDGWSSEFERPIYFLEHRTGYYCGWCSLLGRQLVVQPHPASNQQPIAFEFPSEIDVIGQVTGVAMVLDTKKRPRARTGAAPAKSPNP